MKPYDAGEWWKVEMGKGQDGSSLSVTATVFTFSPHFLPTIPGAIKGGIYKHLLHLALSKTVQLAKLVYTSLLGPRSQTTQGVQLTAPVLIPIPHP